MTIMKYGTLASLLLTAAPLFAQDAPVAAVPSPTPAAEAAPQVRPAAPQPQVGADWPFYGGGESAQRYSPLSQITPDNVGKLERAFVFHTGDLPSENAHYSPEATPLKVGRSLVMCSAKNILISVNAATYTEPSLSRGRAVQDPRH
ncbi:hypothetical protein QCN27_18270 [Cereibacter sp. SYSU M97828]|nr:hypothetical protein [Cereibacter flavus]